MAILKDEIANIANNDLLDNNSKIKAITTLLENNLFEESPDNINGNTIEVSANNSLNPSVYIQINISQHLQNNSNNFTSKENTEKPLDDLKKLVWAFITKGKRKYIVVPALILSIAVISFPDYKDKFTKGISSLGDTFKHETSITKDEYDVMNEWVAQIWSFDDLAKAKEEYANFIKAYKDSHHQTWGKDICLVRSYKDKGCWLIVIDMDYGKSTQDEIQLRIDNLKQFSSQNRELQNTLGNWLQNYSVIYYEKAVFEKTYGKIKDYKKKSFE